MSAGDEILKVYHSDFDVSYKYDNSPLTRADMAAHHLIVEHLKSLTPEIPVLSEESKEVPFDVRRQWRQYWLVDPLDGTREFVKRNGEFTVNIALIENHTPTAGVVYAPVTRDLYHALQGQGAYYVDPSSEQASKIEVRQFCLEKVAVIGSRSHASDELKVWLERLENYSIESIGSSLKMCLVARGQADIYPRLGLTSEWDTAAAHCIVNEAGGLITDTQMNELRYNTKESLLNPFFFAFGDRSNDWSRYL